ncbi:MAG: M14 family metallopeptidase [Bacteroidota bacterium]
MKYILLAYLLLPLSLVAQISEKLITRAEKTFYKETSSSQDVVDFVEAVKAESELVHVESMFTSKGGKISPVVVMASPKINSPKAAKESGKIIVYIQGNIHAGEVEGKETLQILMREILFEGKKHLLDNQILIFAPNFNVDGNDKLGENRPSQDESPKLTGERRSGEDLDLNRDGVKMEGIETKALFANVILKWDPDVFVDLHTTNGTWHGNQLTYAHSYLSAGDPATSSYTENTMLPAIKEKVLKEYGLHFDIYGGYSLRQGWPPKNLYTYNHHPRYLVNQFGLRNRIAILSETFAHLKFYDRIHAAHTFVTEILEYTHIHGGEIQAINKKSEEASINLVKEQGGKVQKGVRFQMVPTEKPFTLRTYDHYSYTDKEGKTKYVRKPNIIHVPNVNNYSAFKATTEATLPKGYLIPVEFVSIVEKLRAHGVEIKQLEKPQKFNGEVFTIEEYKLATRKFEHHYMATAIGEFREEKKRFPAGSYHIDLAQPLANLIFYLLEPQSDDGLLSWNFFDDFIGASGKLEQAVAYPVFKYW